MVWDLVSVQGKGLELSRVMTLGKLQSTILLCCKPQLLVSVRHWLLQVVLKNSIRIKHYLPAYV